jgi:hypothetical protein
MRVGVLACFNPQWPNLNFAVACFGLSSGDTFPLREPDALAISHRLGGIRAHVGAGGVGRLRICPALEDAYA